MSTQDHDTLAQVGLTLDGNKVILTLTMVDEEAAEALREAMRDMLDQGKLRFDIGVGGKLVTN
jgi:transposase-like protein